MRINEIQPIKPLTPQQARVSALKQQKERAGDMLKAEKDRQKQQQERDKICNAQQTLTKIGSS
jgi:hypothetical protein